MSVAQPLDAGERPLRLLRLLRQRFSFLTALAMASALPAASLAQSEQGIRPVTISVDAKTSLGKLPPVWRFFGADEPNYATMKDGRKLLTELGELRSGEVYFRAHNLLSSGDGTPAFKWGSTNAYSEDAQGKPIYNWSIVDRIIDTYLARGIRPYLQIGFMPEAMSSAPKDVPYQHLWRPGFAYNLIATGWSYPPKDYARWAELVYQWTRHNVERYGQAEVERWYFEVWNEANARNYWQGSPEDFYKLHDMAVDAVRRALPTARVGGPDVAGPGGDFMDGFLRHVTTGKNYATSMTGTPTDFLSFHAKGRPTFENGHVAMGLAIHLREVDGGFGKIAGVPALAAKPVVIGESDPEGCAACPGPQNAYRNGTMYSSYTAASFPRILELAQRRKVNLEGVLTWAFEFEDQPWFAGYRQLSTNGVDLPVLNVFRLFSKMGAERIAATSSAQLPLDTIMKEGVRQAADIGTLATRSADGSLAILVWHYHDEDVPGPDAAVQLSIAGWGGKGKVAQIWRVDKDHANAFTAWQRAGAPQSPNDKMYPMLEEASRLKPEAAALIRSSRSSARLDLVVPRQGVALVVIDGR